MIVAEVIRMPRVENRVMVVGSALTCPTICTRWLWPKRVKSGLFRESVA